jgi:hypothetical protein
MGDTPSQASLLPFPTEYPTPFATPLPSGGGSRASETSSAAPRRGNTMKISRPEAPPNPDWSTPP